MKISMWMIRKQLDNAIVSADIRDGSCCIDRFYIYPGEKKPDKQFEEGCALLQRSRKGISIRNGQDSILVSLKMDQVINELAALFYRFDQWDKRLKEILVSTEDPQILLDILEEACPYPLVFMELDGSILAMSKNYKENEVNDNWFEMKTSGQVPLDPERRQFNETADKHIVNDAPQYLEKSPNEHFIAMYFFRNGQPVMGMLMIEFSKPFTPDIYQICTYYAETFKAASFREKTQSAPLRTRASILYDLLEENDVQTSELDYFYENEEFIFPWQLVTIRSLFRKSDIADTYLLDYFSKNTRIRTVMLNYDDQIVALVQERKMSLFLKELENAANVQYYAVGISLPFQSLKRLSVRYQQAVFAQDIEKTAGIRYCGQYVLDYMVITLRKNGNVLDMIHPALEILRAADERKNSELYATLWMYLNHERSIHATAEAMFVHRNSMLYRIKRIEELTQINLNDPRECEYLRISFLIEGAQFPAVD